MDTSTIWQEVRKRRNLFFLCWVGWLPVGGTICILYQLLFHRELPVVMGYSIFFGWGALWFWTSWRLRQLRCPKCRKPAIANPFFFMKEAQCKHCGLAYEKT